MAPKKVFAGAGGISYSACKFPPEKAISKQTKVVFRCPQMLFPPSAHGCKIYCCKTVIEGTFSMVTAANVKLLNAKPSPKECFSIVIAANGKLQHGKPSPRKGFFGWLAANERCLTQKNSKKKAAVVHIVPMQIIKVQVPSALCSLRKACERSELPWLN